MWDVKSLKSTITGWPTLQQIFCGLVVLFVISYLVWGVWPKPVVDTKNYQQTKPVITNSKESGPTLKGPIKIISDEVVAKKLPEVRLNKTEHVVDTAKIPKAPEGGKTVTVIDTDTNDVTTEFKPNAAPWLGFEDQNYVGIGASQDLINGGQRLKGYYKRDIIRSKGLHLQMEIQGNVPINGTTGKSELLVGPNLEVRF